MQLIGREREQDDLRHYAESPRPEFVVVYGRRRVGKTYLVRQYFNNRFAFYATGIAGGSMREQFAAFNVMLRRQGGTGDARTWIDAFERLRELLESGEALRDAQAGKLVIFLDEMPWFDTPRSGFLSALEFFWNGWASARDDILLIVCGSAISWIVRKLFQNHGGLHNRITGRIHLKPFVLGECEQLFHANGVALSRSDVVEAYMIFGGIPFYLELFDRRFGLLQNVDALCFARTGQLRHEFDELFRSLFRHPERQIAIVRALASRRSGMLRDEILSATGIEDGGTFTNALSELEHSGLIRRYQGFAKGSRGGLYQLIDPFTLFWLRFVERSDDERWWSANHAGAPVRTWTGQAFELVCLLHVSQLLRALGVWGVSVGAYAWRGGASGHGAQIGLVLDRADGIINLCEMKWVASGTPFVVTMAYEQGLLRRVEAFAEETKTPKALHLTMVTPGGVQHNAHSGCVQACVTERDLFAC